MNKPHIATLRKQAAKMGLTIKKQDFDSVFGTNLYTIGQNDEEHEHAEMLTLNGIQQELIDRQAA